MLGTVSSFRHGGLLILGAGGGELVDTTAVVCHLRCRNDPGRNHG